MGLFNRLFGGIREGRKLADAVEILVRTYNVSLTDGVNNIISGHLDSNNDFCNEHDLAVWCLADISRYLLDPANPMAKKEITEWIRRAKGAKRRGLFSSGDYEYNDFLKAAEERFGIDHTKIDAA